MGSKYHMVMFVRNYPGRGLAAGISMQGGKDYDQYHYTCSFQYNQPCTVMIRFDNEKPENYVITQPDSMDNSVMYLFDSVRFINKLKTSKKVMISASFFNHGDVIYEFDVTSLDYKI